MADTVINPDKQITFSGKLAAGLLLVFFTAAAIYLLMAYWPNKMPPIKEGDDGAWYTNQRFNITLIENDSLKAADSKSIQNKIDTIEKQLAAKKDSLKTKADSIAFANLTDSLKKLKTKKEAPANTDPCIKECERIHLNRILLILVALMGFLGNMVHIASSFTSYVGNGTFLRSWVLWYFVKPFTAAGLAIIVYFIIRAGFLSYGAGASGISLYGIMALSALAGLFTDSATLKLKEVFEVIFKPRDERTGKLQGDTEVTVTSITPSTVAATGDTVLILTGKGLNTADIKITMDNAEIKPAVQTAERLEIKYSPAPAALTAKKTVLVITNKAGKTIFNKEIAIS